MTLSFFYFQKFEVTISLFNILFVYIVVLALENTYCKNP